jgi:hypothetical protein
MNQATIDFSLSVEQSQNVAIEGGALAAPESEITVLDLSLLALIGGGDGAVIW